MIKRFSTLFAGHVDLGDMGQDATPVNERRYSNEHLASVFEKTEALARVMDDLGYDALWFAEHHFQHEGYECIPNLLMFSVHLAHMTRNLRFGCGFNITPMWHPLRLAEDFAVADILTHGRVIFGVGRGYHTREVESLQGAALFVRREAADAVGLFDEEFFMFSEETDWTYRFHQAGWTVAFLADAEVVHVGGASHGGRLYVENLRGLLRVSSGERRTTTWQRKKRLWCVAACGESRKRSGRWSTVFRPKSLACAFGY